MTADHSSQAKANGTTTDRPPAETGWVLVGEIVGTFGIRGQVKVLPLTDFPERFQRTKTAYVGDEHTPMTVSSAQQHKNVIVLTLAGIDTADAAETLRGKVVSIPESELTPLPPDQFYLHDVVGLRVEHVNGQPLGVITDVITSGGNDIFLVRNQVTGRATLLPAVKAFVKEIDIPGGRVRVEPIPGLFDEGAEEAGG
jgi:16S rRNA processing protein RimM